MYNFEQQNQIVCNLRDYCSYIWDQISYMHISEYSGATCLSSPEPFFSLYYFSFNVVMTYFLFTL